MSGKSKQHDKAFKESAIKYVETHPELTQEECARNLGVGLSTLSRWRRESRKAGGEVSYQGSGNYASEEAKEIARLKRELRKNRLKKRIMQIYHASYQNYGAPKITESLRQEGEAVSERTVGKYMKEMGIRAQWVRHRTRTTRDSDYSTELHNILNEDFHPHRPNEAWCTDITYIWTQAGFVYLSSVMDLFSRRIIAWSLSKTLDASLVMDAVNLAKARRNVLSPLILHSDRGCQYTSSAYREASAGFRLSYSKKGYPYDNACMEAFHSLIKREWLDRVLIRNFQHAYSSVFEYIETFYNTVRIHSHCGFLFPLCFEASSLLPRHS